LARYLCRRDGEPSKKMRKTLLKRYCKESKIEFWILFRESRKLRKSAPTGFPTYHDILSMLVIGAAYLGAF
jgi:hypothetical protein